MEIYNRRPSVRELMCGDRETLLAATAARLQVRADDLVERQLRVLRTHHSYAQVPDDDLRRSCRRNVMRVVATLEQHDRLPPEIEEDERASGQRRALQGVPSDAVVEAYRAVLAELRDAFIEEAGAVGAKPRDVLAGTKQLWDLTDRFSSVLVSARQQVELDSARRDERHRIAFLQSLLTGSVATADLVQGGAVYGVLPNRSYWVLRGKHHAGNVRSLSRHLETVAAGSRPLVALIEGDVAGISTLPPGRFEDAVVAVAGPATLADVPQAFAEATRVLNVAVRYGHTGVVDSSSLSVRIAVEQHTELGERLYRHYIANLIERTPSSQQLVDTVRTYLREQRSVTETARLLSIHQNTVRYRLDRYQKIVDADLADTDVLVELWWALQYANIRQGDG